MHKAEYILRNTIKKFNMINNGDSIVVGVSGGPDSICLLHILKNMQSEYDLKLYAVHLNHKFRGKDADEDADYVEMICRQWGIPSFIETFDVPAYIKETGMSPEEAGREIRYKLFYRVQKEVGAKKIAVAQNLNDNAETIIMRFMRGTGIEGLKGIDAVRDNIIRPLIEVERSYIEDYCREFNLNPRIDKTNLEAIYNRNRIRLELIPYIREHFNPNIMKSLIRFAEIIKDENDFLENEGTNLFKTVAVVDSNSIQYTIIDLKEAHISIQRRAIRQGIEKLAGSLAGYEYKHIESLLNLISKPTGSAINLPKGLSAYISYGKLIITAAKKQKTEKFLYSLKEGINLFKDRNTIISVERKHRADIEGIKSDSCTIYIDEDKIKTFLQYRNRREGDIFSPIGMKGTKKLKDYFIDEKIPREKRDNIELIADGNEIVWIVGKRISDKYKITKETENILVIKYLRGTCDEK